MKRFLSILFPLLLCCSIPFTDVDAQETLGEYAPTAIITGPDEIVVGRTLVLDASSSRGLGENTKYRWYVEGIPQPISRTVEVVYTPERIDTLAIRVVINTTINGEEFETEAEKIIVVYARKIVLVADSTVPREKLELHQATAQAQGVYLRIMQPAEPTLPVNTEEVLSKLLSEQRSVIPGAEAVVLWTDGITGLQSLLRATDKDDLLKQHIEGQTLMLITDRSLKTLARTVRGPFSVLNPARILITRKEAINPLIAAENLSDFLQEIEQRDIDFIAMDESSLVIRPWNLLASLVNYMLTHGVSSQVIVLLLTLPIIAMLLAFFKQIIGITTFGLYTPSVIALSFLALGWQIGMAFLLFILITGYLTRAVLKRWRLLYIPKVAIILTVVSITLLLLLGLAAAFSITFNQDTIFVLLIMSTLAESFLTAKTEEGLISATIGIGETIGAAWLCFFIVSWPALKSFLLAYPEIILLTIFVDIALGRWTGLRVVEYFRFREVFSHLQEE
ncbi:MAG: 7TM domain-containing protein [Candidatus Peribacteraceae bacterium]